MTTIAPPRFRDRTLDGYQPRTDGQRKALDAARRMAAGQLDYLALSGKAGVGKTHLAAAVVRETCQRLNDAWAAAIGVATAAEWSNTWPERPAMPLWINVADAIGGLRLEMDTDDREASTLLRRARSHRGLVVLDDLGREKVSDWTGEVVYALVNARYEAMLPMLVTTNLTAGELGASVYWPALSRIAEDGELVRVDGLDWRLGKGREVAG